MPWTMLAAGLYAALTMGGLIVSGLPIAYWKGVVQPVLRPAPAFGRTRSGRSLIPRVAGAIALTAFFALLVIARSPLEVYRCLWELWRWARGPRPPPPSKEPAMAKRVKAA